MPHCLVFKILVVVSLLWKYVLFRMCYANVGYDFAFLYSIRKWLVMDTFCEDNVVLGD